MADSSKKSRRAARKRKLRRIWNGFLQLTSLIGIISIVDALQSWARLIATILRFVRDNIPWLLGTLLAAGAAIHAAIEVYRAICHPPINALFGWLPFQIPGVIKDVFIVAALGAYGALRIRIGNMRRFDRLIRSEREALIERARAYGMSLDLEEAQRVEVAVSDYYWVKRAREGSVELGSYDRWRQEGWQAALDEFGPGLAAFARDHEEAASGSRELRRLLARDRRMLTGLQILAGLAIFVVALDFIVFG